MKESNIMRLVQIRCSELGARLMRNNVGKAWAGEEQRLPGGDLILRNPRRIHFGLAKGSGDLIGWTPVKITEDMVGSTLAVFTSIEVKTKKGRPTDDQIAFAQVVILGGGSAFVIRDPSQLELALYGRYNPCTQSE
jgi:hypothetical protein